MFVVSVPEILHHGFSARMYMQLLVDPASFRVVRGRCVHYLDTPLEPKLHKQNRLETLGRFMGDSPGIHGRLLGAPLVSTGPRNISPAYGQRAESSFPRIRVPSSP